MASINLRYLMGADPSDFDAECIAALQTERDALAAANADLARGRDELLRRVASARADALEEAAGIADADGGKASGGNMDFGPNVARRIAGRIRAARTLDRSAP